MSNVDVVVIGAGVTGSAIARDSAMRGIRTLVVERDTIGSGTSGRFHSMLQSGARYVVTDTAYAAECMRERRIMERIAPFARRETEGIFVSFDEDEPAFMDSFADAARQADIPIERLSTSEVAQREPAIAATRGGFSVPGAVFHPWEMVPAVVASAIDFGAEFLTQTSLVSVEGAEGQVTGVVVRGNDGRTWSIACSALIIAAGAWPAGLGPMAGLDITVETAKGAMLVLPDEVVSSVVNRCRPPQSYDIAVPLNGSTVFGTTSSIVESPDDIAVTDEEFETLVREARRFLPYLGSNTTGWSAYAGVRPLVSAAPGEGGAVSRKHAVFEGTLAGAYGIVGGSFTSHRSMAEDVVNRVAKYLGNDKPSLTAETPLRPTTAAPWAETAPMQPRGIARPA